MENNRSTDTKRVDMESYANATSVFVEKYNKFALEAIQLERTNNAAAADWHVKLSTIIARYLHAYEKFVDPSDKLFLRQELVSRCMQALVLRSMQLSGFADLALSMSSTRNLQDDIEKARRRLEDARDGGDDDDDSTTTTEDPRLRTKGLYEFVPYERLDASLSDLPGYEAQHRQIVNAYFIVNGDREQLTRVNETAERKPGTLAGANVILHGPPGTGKTAAARAVARTLGLNLAFVNAENLLSAYRSETEKNLRTLYEMMRKIVRVSGRNVVLLLDEVDGLVKNRRAGGAVTSGEYSLLTRFLTILEPNDGKDNYGVFSVFTTNRLANLDDAFRRRCASVFMGYVSSPDARVRLFDAFMRNTIDYSTRGRNVEARVAELCEHWVPGDHARFKRSTIDPFQLEKYFERTNTTFDDFIATRLKNDAGGNNREIVVDLPSLPYDEVFRLMRDYHPITPSDRYHEYTE